MSSETFETRNQLGIHEANDQRAAAIEAMTVEAIEAATEETEEATDREVDLDSAIPEAVSEAGEMILDQAMDTIIAVLVREETIEAVEDLLILIEET